MSTARWWATAAILGLSTGLAAGWAIAWASPPAPVPVEADWQTRSTAWFSAADEEGRRKEMRAITRALRQPCRYCHTPDFTGYTEMRAISQQMMAASAESGVRCDECHAGRDGLTPLGETSASMWALARAREQFCDACHTPNTRFGELTAEGARFKADGWAEWQASWAARAVESAGAPGPGRTGPKGASPVSPEAPAVDQRDAKPQSSGPKTTTPKTGGAAPGGAR